MAWPDTTIDLGPVADRLDMPGDSRNTRSDINRSMPGNVLRKLPISWSSTLSLPKSSFPARPIVADRKLYLDRCSKDLYVWQQAHRSENHTFTLHDGPPYANGDLHVGHALNKILKDITCRYQLSQGKRINYVPGWDCHGLPIEQKALQQGAKALKSTKGHMRDPVEVRLLARALAANAVKMQQRSFQKWGIMADWDNAWTTMDKDYELRQLEIFKRFVQRGLIYRRFKPVWWSPSSRTALAESELEYKDDHVSNSAFVTFSSVDVSEIARSGLEEVSAVIWTTTPWTLPANKAIGVHSTVDYVVVSTRRRGNLLVAASRLDTLRDVCKEELPILIHLKGADIVGGTYQDRVLNPETRPFLHADFVSADSGSGLVHLAPGHGQDDYQLCLQHQISAAAPVDGDGCFTSNAFVREPKMLEGMAVLDKGNEAVLDLLAKHDLLLSRQRYKHKYPYDWRSKQPVITRATSQWFADVGAIQEEALRSLEKVRFIPHAGKERLTSFLCNRKEWCISRQRAWGVPIPALYNQGSGEIVMTEDSIDHIVNTIRSRGIDAWWTDVDDDPAWTPPGLRQTDGTSQFRRENDTMDVWFDSGTSWTQMKSNIVDHGIPTADLYLEGSDQHRGWFQSSLLTSIADQGEGPNSGHELKAPFETLVTHGFIVDSKGQKMSKSVGNVVSPDEIMEGTLLPPLKRKKRQDGQLAKTGASSVAYDAMGPDALRLWVASSDFTKDVSLSETVLKAINGTLAKYRVTFKLLLGMLQDFVPAPLQMPFSQLGMNHQLILTHLRRTEERVHRYYNKFEYNKVTQEINNFVNADLSAMYIETVKDTIYADTDVQLLNGPKAQALYTMEKVFTVLQRMLGAITPVLVEEVWNYTPEVIQKANGHPQRNIVDTPLVSQNVSEESWRNEMLEQDLPMLSQLNDSVKALQEALRSEKKMGSSLQSFVLLQTDKEMEDNPYVEVLQRWKDHLATFLVVSKISICRGGLPDDVANSQWRRETSISVGGHSIKIHVYAPSGAKCVRCWRYSAPLGVKPEQALCGRCEAVLKTLERDKPELFEEHPRNPVAVVA